MLQSTTKGVPIFAQPFFPERINHSDKESPKDLSPTGEHLAVMAHSFGDDAVVIAEIAGRSDDDGVSPGLELFPRPSLVQFTEAHVCQAL